MPTSYMNEHNTRIWTFIRVGEWRYFSWYHKVFLFVFNYHIDSFIIAFLSHTSSSWKGFFRWEQTEIVLNCFPGITWLLTTNSRVNHLACSSWNVSRLKEKHLFNGSLQRFSRNHNYFLLVCSFINLFLVSFEAIIELCN